MNINKDNFLKNVIGFSLSTWIGFLISFISVPISTVLFAPEELGKINLFNTYALLFTSISMLGLDQAYLRFYKEPIYNKSKNYLFTFCFIISLIFLFLAGIIILLFNKIISIEIVGQPDYLVAVMLIIYALAGIGMSYLNLSYRMEQEIKLFTIQTTLRVLVTKILFIAAGFWYASYRPAIITMSVSYLFLTFIFIFIQRENYEFKKFKITKDFTFEISKFAAPFIPITFLVWANNSLSQIILRRYLGFSYVGIFTTALGLASIINVVQSGFNLYWTPYVYENYKKENNKFWPVHKVIVCCLIFMGLFIILFQDPIFLLIGEKYKQSKEFFSFLLLSPICYTISETTGLGINISKKTKWNLFIYGFSMITNLLLCIFLIPLLNAAGAAISLSISSVLTIIIKTHIGEKYYKSIHSYKHMFIGILSIFLAAIANYIFFEDVLFKYCLTILIIIIDIIFFRKEIKILYKAAFEIFCQFINKYKNK